jgi:hypothetical protein
MNNITKTLAALAGLALGSAAANAAVSVSTSGGDLLDATGTILHAVNLGNGNTLNNGGAQSTYTHIASSIVFDNASFTGNHTTGNYYIDISGNLGGTANQLRTSTTAATHFGSAVVNGADALYYSATWVNGGSTNQSVDIGGLDAGKSYMVQILAGDARAESWAAWDFNVVVDGADTGSNFAWGVQHGTDIEKNVLIVEGITGVTSTSITLLGGGDAGSANSPGISGFIVTEVPEPSTTALLGLGGLALIFRRRK